MLTEVPKATRVVCSPTAASHENAKCARYFTRDDDGLRQEWIGRVFMNPPYGRVIGAWMRKAWESSQTTAELVVCLVPARTDTAWWHDYAVRGEIEFLRGRLRFGDMRASAPFPSAIVVFRNAQAVTKDDAEDAAEISSAGRSMMAAACLAPRFSPVRTMRSAGGSPGRCVLAPCLPAGPALRRCAP